MGGLLFFGRGRVIVGGWMGQDTGGTQTGRQARSSMARLCGFRPRVSAGMAWQDNRTRGSDITVRIKG